MAGAAEWRALPVFNDQSGIGRPGSGTAVAHYHISSVRRKISRGVRGATARGDLKWSKLLNTRTSDDFAVNQREQTGLVDSPGNSRKDSLAIYHQIRNAQHAAAHLEALPEKVTIANH